MNGQERLFLAIGEADPALVARSEKRQGRSWPRYGLTIAAGLALAFTLGWLFPVRTDAATLGSHTLPPITEQDPPAVQSPGQLLLPERGGEIGNLRLLSYTPELSGEAVDFLIYVNEEKFAIQEENGLYSIRSVDPLPEGSPACGMDIFHLSAASPGQARSDAEAALRERYPVMTTEEPAAALPDGLYLRAGESLEPGSEESFWRAEQAELWFVDDGQGGTFVLVSRYFLEAEEGLGALFRDMASSFRVVDLTETAPDWMRTLYAAVDRLSPALFSNDLSGVSDLLTEETEADAYGEDVWADAAIVSVDCAPDDDQDPAEAVVSVKHRLNRAEGDSFSYLTMELARRDGSWHLIWSGIEK